MKRRKEETNKNKNRVIIILMLLVIFLCTYIYLGGVWTSEDDDLVIEEDKIEQVEEQEISNEIQIQEDDQIENNTTNEDVEIQEEVVEVKKENEAINEVEPEIEKEIEEKEEVADKPLKDVKFGLSFSKRNGLWWKYQKRQKEIQDEAGKLNDDRFSKTYLGHVERNMKKLRYDLKNEYKIDDYQLDYILKEGKDGKFNESVQSF